VKHVVCYSGGHSSALVGIEVARRYSKENVILLNHDIPAHTEDADIKRFKREVADYLGLPITYANHKDPNADQFDVCVQAQAFKVNDGRELCTNRLKTEPFMRYLAAHHADKECVIYYGFDANETDRIQRRSSFLGALDYRTDYPLALWPDRTISSTLEIGIELPNTYSVFIHANCVGCLKAGLQHWYVVYCTRPDIWERAKWAEEEIGYAIHHDDNGPVYLEDIEPKFEAMRRAGIPATERMSHQKFWGGANKIVKISVQQQSLLPCECIY
jgi:hypothetical protein